jgi:flagellar export protein FliJ
LQTLIRLHEWKVDEKRRQLGELIRLLDGLEEQARRLEEEVAREQKVAAAAPTGAGYTYGDYALAVIERRERLKESIAQAEKAVEQAREELRAAYRELKSFQVTQANRRRREEDERNRREQAVLDEIGLQTFRVKQRRAG